MIRRALVIGEKVEVYWNFNKKCYSVKALEGDDKGRVVSHTSVVRLVDVQFVVSEAGRQRVLREKRKNVHARMRGYVSQLRPEGDVTHVSYNPYKMDHFQRLDGKKIYWSLHVLATVRRGFDNYYQTIIEAAI